MHLLKNPILGIGLAAVCGYSLFQKLQWPAVLSLALLIGLLSALHSRSHRRVPSVFAQCPSGEIRSS